MRTYRGTNGRDVFDGTRNAERVYGYAGNDDLFGYGGDDLLYGGKGKDLLVGDDGDDKLYGQQGSDLLAGERGTDQIDGGTGYDYATYVYDPAGVDIDLRFGTATDGYGDTDTLTSIEGVYGSDKADRIVGDTGSNELFGNDGNDVLIGWAGQDLTVGNKGADLFLFNDGDISDTVGKADLIGDFTRSEGDKIDLTRIDANTNAAGDQAFTFIGTDAFSGKAGELRFEMSNGELVLAGDVDGDKVADGFIRVEGANTLVAGDFLL